MSRVEVFPSADRRTREIPLLLDRLAGGNRVEPITTGVPFPRGLLAEMEDLALVDAGGDSVPSQWQVLSRWPDGSIQWSLLDFLLDPDRWRQGGFFVRVGSESRAVMPSGAITTSWRQDAIVIDAGALRCSVNRRRFAATVEAVAGSATPPFECPGGIVLRDRNGRDCLPAIDEVVIEADGPIRSTLRFEGHFAEIPKLRFRGRLSWYMGTGLLRVEACIHNSGRARHKGGLWDLGDDGSLLFQELAVKIPLAPLSPRQVDWWPQADSENKIRASLPARLYQDSSGGENWQSSNHVNRDGVVPCSFRGYRLDGPGVQHTGDRASPTVGVAGADGTNVVVAVGEFWQQFPKAIAWDNGTLAVHLFPGEFADLHELQGGEKKRQEFWIHVEKARETNCVSVDPLTWVHGRSLARPTPDWFQESAVLPYFTPAEKTEGTRLEQYLEGAVSGPSNLFLKRETIDEYGWRNFGDVYGDHEAAFHRGSTPLVSHYNNQFDMVLGFLTQHLRGAKRCWWDLADPLARHVIDIDIYHTREDKATYNGGLFWFTDHYLDASTSSHRTYSKNNAPKDGSPYGGGPSSMHVFSSGLLLYYYLTGAMEAREAVLELADWLIHSEDGRLGPLRFLDDGPTGVTSGDGSPNRAAGNTINTVLDAFLLTRSRVYLDHATLMVRRTVHPLDDLQEHDLLDVEHRWSYTVFLSALDRFLETKAELGELDDDYAHAQACFRKFGAWMLEHERPYFEQEEKLEFPTEAWGAQEFRKANVLRLAARHEVEPTRSAMVAKGRFLADRAWRDLLRFETRHAARAIAVVLVEGTRDAYFETEGVPPLPALPPRGNFGPRVRFVPLKARIKRRMKSPGGALALVGHALNPRHWMRGDRRTTP